MTNIQDMESPPVTEGKDMLEEIFDFQRDLLKKYIPIESKQGRWFPEVPIDINSPRVQAFVKEEIFRVVIELSEAADCMKNKYWKQDHVATDIDHMMEELADALHFFVETCIWLKIDAGQLRDLYMKKAQVNVFRQRSNY